MKSFDYYQELNRLIKDRQLVEIYLSGAPTFKVAYLLHADADYLTFAEVGSNASFNGVTICSADDVDSVSTGTPYLNQLAEQLDPAVYKQGLQHASLIKDFSFAGFVSAFAGTNTLVEVTQDNETVIAGRLIAQDDHVLALDEYSTDAPERIARTYISKDRIIRLSVDVPWTRTITRFLSNNNL